MVVKLDEKTGVRKEVPVAFSDITPGMYVRAIATKQADGTFRASPLHIFSEDQRGVGGGHRPLSSAPQSGQTMTDANVEAVEDIAVENIRGRMLTLKHKSGAIRVVVDDHVGAFAGAAWSKGAADAFAGAGDENDFFGGTHVRRRE